MKYFIQLENRGIFVLDEEEAYELYVTLAWAKIITHVETEEAFKTGMLVERMHTAIWGEEMDDKELFRKILQGKISRYSEVADAS